MSSVQQTQSMLVYIGTAGSPNPVDRLKSSRQLQLGFLHPQLEVMKSIATSIS